MFIFSEDHSTVVSLVRDTLSVWSEMRRQFVRNPHSEGYYIVVAAGNTDDPAVQRILEQAGRTAVENLAAALGERQ